MKQVPHTPTIVSRLHTAAAHVQTIRAGVEQGASWDDLGPQIRSVLTTLDAVERLLAWDRFDAFWQRSADAVTSLSAHDEQELRAVLTVLLA